MLADLLSAAEYTWFITWMRAVSVEWPSHDGMLTESVKNVVIDSQHIHTRVVS